MISLGNDGEAKNQHTSFNGVKRSTNPFVVLVSSIELTGSRMASITIFIHFRTTEGTDKSSGYVHVVLSWVTFQKYQSLIDSTEMVTCEVVVASSYFTTRFLHYTHQIASVHYLLYLRL